MPMIDSAPSATLSRVVSLVLAMLLAIPAGAVLAQDATPPARPAPLPKGFDELMAGKVDTVVDAAVRLRRLPDADGVAYRVVDKATFRSELEDLFGAEYSDAYVAAEDDLYTRLGLIAADVDLKEVTLSLFESQVLAYYDPTTTTFSLIGPVDRIGPMESVVVAHEYGHALQDAEWDLEGSRVTDLSRADEILAQQALAEGDATALMRDYMAREMSPLQILRMTGQALTQQDEKLLRRIPPLLRRQLEFPYIDGYAFVNALLGRGDWAAVDTAWDARPESTEQIMHPELYPDETPVEVVLPDVAGLLGPDWSASYKQTLGEMQIGVWVADGRKPLSLFPGLPGVLPRAEAAAGWGGDRLVSLDGPEGSWAVAWQSDWDSSRDAVEFDKAARDALEDLAAASDVSDADISGGLSSPVLVLVADSRMTLDAVTTALGLDP